MLFRITITYVKVNRGDSLKVNNYPQFQWKIFHFFCICYIECYFKFLRFNPIFVFREKLLKIIKLDVFFFLKKSNMKRICVYQCNCD